jgi:hypothetical protein
MITMQKATLTLTGSFAEALGVVKTEFRNLTPTITPTADVALLDLLKRVEEFTTADEIGRFFFDEGVRGRQNDPEDCPFAKWIKVVTGQAYRVGSGYVAQPDDPTELIAELSPVARAFIRRFDAGCYPQLVQGAMRASASLCGCASCAAMYGSPVLFEAVAA